MGFSCCLEDLGMTGGEAVNRIQLEKQMDDVFKEEMRWRKAADRSKRLLLQQASMYHRKWVKLREQWEKIRPK